MEIQSGVKILTTVAENLLARDSGCMLVQMAFSNTDNLIQDVPNVRKFDIKMQPAQLGQVDYSHFWYCNPPGFAILAYDSPH